MYWWWISFFAVRTSKFLHLRWSLIRALRRAKKKTKRVIHLKKFNAMKSKTHLLKKALWLKNLFLTACLILVIISQGIIPDIVVILVFVLCKLSGGWLLPAAYVVFRSKLTTLGREETIGIVRLEIQFAGNKINLSVEVAQYLIVFFAWIEILGRKRSTLLPS